MFLAALLVASSFTPGMHAHNDYYNARPLHDALERGFGSIEADVFPVDGTLWVAHDTKELKPDRTLKSLYIEPLRRWLASGHGGRPIQLMIDIKQQGDLAVDLLEREIEPLRPWLSEFSADGFRRRAVTVIISGDRPVEKVRAINPRRIFVDGRFHQGNTTPGDWTLAPMVSDAWGSHFRWNGTGPMPEAERAKLRALVQACNNRRQTLRFWGNPSNLEVWRELRRAGVHWIGTDQRPTLVEFLATPER
jgi:hypothetical protein